ncbi:MAG: 4Fe-4S dicluster domain-containing protein [Candidatus Hodarchaeota archaeon]
MGLFHFKPSEDSFFRKFFLNIYARFEIPYLKLNALILHRAHPSKIWRPIFMPFIYLNAFIMLRYGQHGKIMTPKEIENLLNSTDNIQIAVGSCRCRLAQPNVCDCELKGDITIQAGAQIYKKHFPKDYKSVTKDEAIQLINCLNKKGLIPSIYTFCMFGGVMHEFVICNCCTHACIPLLAQKIIGFHTYDPGNSLARVVQQKCSGCGTCVNICQMDARSLSEYKTQVNPILCIGCGACEQNCPNKATDMIKRPNKVLKKQLSPLRSFVIT